MRQIYLTIFLVFFIFNSEAQTQLGQTLWGDAQHDRFGWSVALGNSDGTLAVGAPYADINGASSGLARIFLFDGTSWNQMGNDILGESAGDEFGRSIDLNDDGQIVVIGSDYHDNFTGQLRVYEWFQTAGNWVQMGPDIDGENAGDWFGYSCSINSAGNIIAGGAVGNNDAGNDAGSARVYQLSGNTWVQLGQDIVGESPDDHCGHSVSLSSDGYTLSVGAGHNSDAGYEAGHVRVYIYDDTLNIWTQKGQDIDGEGTGPDQSGISNSISSDGNTVAIGANRNFNPITLAAGHVRVHKYDGTDWIQVGQDIDGLMNSENAGRDVSLSGDGSVLILGAIHNNTNGIYSGQARVYELTGGSWVQIGLPINGPGPDDYMGWDTDINRAGTMVAVGAMTASGGPNGSVTGMVQVYDISTLVPTNDLENKDLFSIYPNPNSGNISVEYHLSENTPSRITLYSILGENIKTLYDQSDNIGYKKLDLQLTDKFGQIVKPGLYIIMFEINGQKIETKVIVQ
ncbi:MAG: T9SS type A sorting domain-containing protein [Lentimicrobiaceae bacterium]|nr:T9SS type A sorting domain-containing protein [Lentimicrobiaceae bacterium]MBT4062148.1 T9SS type A sorting domain-containing protein [Lentimicrobiaceae bacterium]MBT4801395.1 T9SS type A sorting domain-containing protein [Lentimicrobiaceae bacterium]MBT6016188.1 T9SS type A sorting domain-containing protein [Lentimicrobiaceae bacterium]MBT7036339.1 T9SS type A sorting domain-containing protein [Lentimicrobiaceae bacterium]